MPEGGAAAPAPDAGAAAPSITPEAPKIVTSSEVPF
jgi:hypothetical protein